MNEFRMSLLKERADAIRPDLTKAREITECAEREHRDFTDDEKAIVEPTLKTARDITDGMKACRDEAALMSTIRSEFGDVLGPLNGADLSGSLSGDKTRRLSFKGLGSQAAARMLPDGTKALAPSGATIVGQEFVRDPVVLGQVAQSLLDVLPTQQHTSTEYAYLRQTGRTNNAAVVAEGAAKPTSVYSVVRVQNLHGLQVRFGPQISRDALVRCGYECCYAARRSCQLDYRWFGHARCRFNSRQGSRRTQESAGQVTAPAYGGGKSLSAAS